MKIINAFYVVLLVMVFSFQSFAQKPLEVPLRDIFFDEGDFILREDAKPILRDNAEFLIMNPDINVVLWPVISRTFNLASNKSKLVKLSLY